jgi:integrase/recombinase XerD
MTTNAANATGYFRRLTAHIDSFLDGFRAAGYAPAAVTSRRLIISAFIRSIASKRPAAEDLSDAVVTAFLKRRPTRREDPKERAVLRRFLAYLRARGVCSPVESGPVTAADEITQRYVGFLRQGRGLAENSIAIYAPCARDFFTYRVSHVGRLALKTLDADTIRTFLLTRIANRSTESSRLLSVSLRSVLRFLFLRGETPRDLSSAVPMVRTYRQSTVPAVLSAEEVQRVLATPDRSTIRGRRDAAILLLLARLGLRASEVVFLELGDLHWRTGEIIIRGKGPQRDRVPLLADVGDTIARYLQHGRGPSASRRVFLRVIPPRVGLARPCAIDHIVRLAFNRAGVPPRPRRVAHLFRHSLATRMIRRGASLPEIAEVLRHRSQSTTAIYAKVSLDALRAVARPWPVGGADR